jgi:hypothetical protein
VSKYNILLRNTFWANAFSVITLTLAIGLIGASKARAWTPPPLRVCVVNRSTLVDNGSVQTVVDALQTQINQHFRLYYYQQREIKISMTRTLGCWPLVIQDGPMYLMWFGRRYAAAGYHVVVGGRPYARVTTYNFTLSMIMDHELLEMLADPSGRGREIVDDWVNHFYQVETNGRSVWVNDFALPLAVGGDFCGTVNYCQ